MKKNFFRKVAFGLSPNEKINEDPLNWAKQQFDTVPKFVWEKKLPNLEEQRDRYGKWVYEDRKVLREKYKNDRLAYEKEKDNLRVITGEKFFEPLELSVRHSTALASNSPAFERMWHFGVTFLRLVKRIF